MLRRVVWEKFTDVSEVLAASIIRAMSHRLDEPWLQRVKSLDGLLVSYLQVTGLFTS
jgi:hypothetical protein